MNGSFWLSQKLGADQSLDAFYRMFKIKYGHVLLLVKQTSLRDFWSFVFRLWYSFVGLLLFIF